VPALAFFTASLVNLARHAHKQRTIFACLAGDAKHCHFGNSSLVYATIFDWWRQPSAAIDGGYHRRIEGIGADLLRSM